MWELKSLQSHYLTDIHKIIKTLGINMDMAKFLELDNFEDITYFHLIQLGFKKIIEKEIKIEIEQPLD